MWDECHKYSSNSFQYQDQLILVYIQSIADDNVKCLTTINYKDRQSVAAGNCEIAGDNAQYQWEIINHPHLKVIMIRHRYYRQCIDFRNGFKQSLINNICK